MSNIKSANGGMMDWSVVGSSLTKDPLKEMAKPGGSILGGKAMQSLASKLDINLELKLGNLTGGEAAPDKQTLGAQVVTSTLDTMNSDPATGAKDPLMETQKSVLGAHAGLGIVDKRG